MHKAHDFMAHTPQQDAPTTVDELIQLGDQAFVQAAYVAILGRQADETGLSGYTALVRAGADKARLVAELALSDEGRQRHQSLAGINALLDQHAMPAPSLLRRAWHRLCRPQREAAEALARSIRVIDNRLYMIETRLREASAHTDELRSAVDHLAADLQGLPAYGAGDPSTVAAPGATKPDGERLHQQVPPTARHLLAQLLRLRARRSDAAP